MVVAHEDDQLIGESTIKGMEVKVYKPRREFGFADFEYYVVVDNILRQAELDSDALARYLLHAAYSENKR